MSFKDPNKLKKKKQVVKKVTPKKEIGNESDSSDKPKRNAGASADSSSRRMWRLRQAKSQVHPQTRGISK